MDEDMRRRREINKSVRGREKEKYFRVLMYIFPCPPKIYIYKGTQKALTFDHVGSILCGAS